MKYNFKLLLILVLLLACQLPAYAQLSLSDQLQIGTSRFNHFGALTEINVNGTTNKYLFYNSIRNIFDDDFVTGVYIKNNADILPLQKLDKRVYEPNVFVTYDPKTMQHLFAAGGTRNFVIQYDYSSTQNVIGDAPGGFFPSNQYNLTFDFQTPCQDALTSPDTLRSIQMVPARNMVYITCKNVGTSLGNRLLVIGYGLQYGPVKMKGIIDPVNTATLAELAGGPTKTYGVLNKNGGTRGKLMGNLSINPSVLLFSPSGNYLYTVNTDNKLHQYTFSATGELTAGNLSGNDGCATTKMTGQQDCKGTPPADYFMNPGSLIIPEQAPLSLPANLTPVSMAFNASGTNVYMVANSVGADGIVLRSTILVFNVNPSTGNLTLSSSDTMIPGNATQIAFHPSGKYAYVLDAQQNLIYQYRVNSDVNGGLTQQPIKPTFNSRLAVQSLIFDPSFFANSFGVEYDRSAGDFMLERITVKADGTLANAISVDSVNLGSSRNAGNQSQGALQSRVRSVVPVARVPVNRGSFESPIRRPAVITREAPNRRGSYLSIPF